MFVKHFLSGYVKWWGVFGAQTIVYKVKIREVTPSQSYYNAPISPDLLCNGEVHSSYIRAVDYWAMP